MSERLAEGIWFRLEDGRLIGADAAPDDAGDAADVPGDAQEPDPDQNKGQENVDL